VADDGSNRRGPERGPPTLLDAAYDDALFRALASDDRRRVLYLLSERGESTVPDLASVLVGWERAGRKDVATRADRDRRATKLRQAHLPVLDAAGLVCFDRETGAVALADLSAPARAVLQWARANETGVDAVGPPGCEDDPGGG
jgi:DNA-binding transcriptional ArsR family regulator